MVEVQEAQEKRTRMVWKLVPEDYYETVKKPVSALRAHTVHASPTAHLTHICTLLTRSCLRVHRV